jgi:ribosomal protein S18 acetylase RimI-like enzyme
MDDVTLGPARVSEAPKLAEMSRALIEQGLRWRWQARPIARLVRSNDAEVVVARRGDIIVGFGAMTFGDSAAHLMLLAVRPEDRLEGTGRRLLAYLEAMARTAGVGQIRLEVRTRNHGARHFYESLGYRETALVRKYYDGRESAVRMCLDLGGDQP